MSTSPSEDWYELLNGAIERWCRFLVSNPDAHATMDFETRSTVDLTKHDTWVYSAHETTDVLCLAYNLPDSDEVHLWHRAHEARTSWNQDAPAVRIPESDLPYELFAFILAGGLVEAHNVMFERMIWHNVCHRRRGWPDLVPGNLRCSASRASYCALPRDLERAVKAMALPLEKDMDGRSLMLKMTKPRKPRKDEVEAWMRYHEDELLCDPKNVPRMPVLWHETEESVYRNHDYCRQDVRAEMALSASIPELPPRELAVWQLDQEMNWRGTRVDLDLARRALKRAEEWKKVLNRELFHLTGVERGSQRQQVREWLHGQGVRIPDTTADTIDWHLENADMDGRCRRVLEIVKQVNRTSTRKYQAMLDKVPEDGYARNLLMYHGASTGRWSGKGIQVHNFPRGNAKNATIVKDGKEKAYFDMDRACEELKSGISTEVLGALSGDVMELLSTSLRGCIVPSEGHELIVADYSAIEARCVLWEAGAEAALEVFRQGGDIYCDMATGIYGYEVVKGVHDEERQFGKQAILGLGYGMGFITFLITCRKYNIKFSLEQVRRIVKNYDKYANWLESYLWPKKRADEDMADYKNRKRTANRNIAKLADARIDAAESRHELVLMKYVVDVYRKRYPEVRAMWAEQEAAAIEAVRQYEAELNARLEAMPDGELFGSAPERLRAELEGPVVEAGKFSWQVSRGFLLCVLPSGRPLRYRDPFLKKEKTDWGEVRESLRYYTMGAGNKWLRTSTYGGKIVENQTQAVARDIMAEAMVRLGDTKYRPLISVHDEAVCEVPVNEGDEREFEALMCATDSWADGCPIVAEAKIMRRYRK